MIAPPLRRPFRLLATGARPTRWYGLILTLALCGCHDKPLPAAPAIWHVVGRDGQEGWLFGTIHAAPAPLAWRGAKIDAALRRSDRIMVEVANLSNEAAVSQAFRDLSHTPGLPPVTERLDPHRRSALTAQLARRGIDPEHLHEVETWAIALTLARPDDSTDSRNGVDRAVLAASAGKTVVELEGARAQLSIFDRLPESEQREMLDAVLADAGVLDDEADLVDIWRKGDMARIEQETRTGLLANPELRAALFTNRNRRWTIRIGEALRAGHRPFIAVGAAHMVGEDGLVVMLREAGFTVRRMQ